LKPTLFASLLCFVGFCLQAQNSKLPTDSSLVESVDTLRTKLPVGKSGLTQQVKYKAVDSVRFNMSEKKVYLYGTAVVDYGDMNLAADFIEVSFETNELHAVGVADSTGVVQGKPVFSSEGRQYTADEMWYNFKTKKGLSSGVLTTESDGFVRGEKFLKDSMDNVYVKNATFTTCRSPEPHFWIAAGKFKIVPKKQVVSGPANLIIEGVNTPLVVPFAFFPINGKRSKGVVFGNYGETQDRGFYLSNWGYYLPINDYFDVKLTADFYFRGSYGFHAVSRYNRRYKYNGQFAFDYNKNLFGEKESTDYRISKDYRLRWSYAQDGKAHPGSSFNANINYVSRNQLKNNSTEVNDIVSSNANSGVSYATSFLKRKVNLNVSSRIDQNLNTGELNARLPDVNLNLVRVQPFANLSGPRSKKKLLRNLGISYETRIQNNLIVNQDSIFNRENGVIKLHDDVKDNLKFGMSHRIPISTNFKAFSYFNISPNFSFTDFWYFKTIEKSWVNDTLITTFNNGFERAASYSASINMNTTIYGYKQFKKGKLYAVRHVVRPTLSAQWSPKFNENKKFGYKEVQVSENGRTEWYSIFEQGILGRPSGGASGSLNLSLANNLEIKVRSDRDTANGGIKKMKIIESFNINSGYNFLADSLKLNIIGLSGNTTLFEKIRISFGGSLDPYQFAFDTALERNVRINSYEIRKGKIGRLTSSRVSLSTNLNPDALKKKTSPNVSEEELEIINAYSNYFVDFNIPWSLNLSYSLNHRRNFDEEASLEQSVTFQGDIRLTENWKIGFQSGYNFARQESTLTKIDFFRDLHCWEFSFGWIPTGQYRRFDFTIRVKSSTLQDLKLTRRGFWYDN
jgi:hypothetical protein